VPSKSQVSMPDEGSVRRTRPTCARIVLFRASRYPKFALSNANGNIYFGFLVLGPTPINLQSGLAHIAPDGTGTWVSAAAASGGSSDYASRHQLRACSLAGRQSPVCRRGSLADAPRDTSKTVARSAIAVELNLTNLLPLLFTIPPPVK
jgi:hypothetical protein